VNLPRYQVNDEEGPLRAFHTEEEAVNFAKDDGYYVIVLGGSPKTPQIDWNNYEESPF
jgi:hypothetical protein